MMIAEAVCVMLGFHHMQGYFLKSFSRMCAVVQLGSTCSCCWAAR